MFIVGVALVNLCSCTKDSPLEIPQVISTIDTLQTSLDPEVNISDCDTSEVSFSTSIVPLISEKCLQCHSGNAPLGGVHLDSYEGVKKVADSGRLYGALSWQAGYEAMPQGADRLPPCELQNVNAWVNAGALNN
ncbi:MAG: hypothetical protein HKN87_13140 [Saprospiraceae bacterium]|nr:hypothetical protein [Saprospiraceae bacterium]